MKWFCKIIPIHTAVPKSKIARKYFIVFIHLPGFGRKINNFGNTPATIYGLAIPNPIKKKMNIITREDWVKAVETAVPTKGAEQGVANTVAKNPLKKSLA